MMADSSTGLSERRCVGCHDLFGTSHKIILLPQIDLCHLIFTEDALKDPVAPRVEVA